MQTFSLIFLSGLDLSRLRVLLVNKDLKHNLSRMHEYSSTNYHQ